MLMKTIKLLKKSKFDTNIGVDFIIDSNIGVGYEIANYLLINMSYVIIFVLTTNLKLY